MELDYRQVTQAELVVVHKLESESYPEDEAASLEMFVYRWTEAPGLTLACFHRDEMMGFVCGTRYNRDSITHESMNKHIPSGKSVCIHSVVVKSEHRRKGIALRLLNKYTQTVASGQEDVTQILLICKSSLIPLYTRAGFTLRGKSDVVHGKDPWYELVLPLTGFIGR